MEDTNIVITLKNGDEVKVIYPLRVFLEYDTPWLEERDGCLETCRPDEALRSFRNDNNYAHNGHLVVGTWMPRYGKKENRVKTIPLQLITDIRLADEEDAAIGNSIRQKEADEKADESYKDGIINRRELAALFPELAEKILTRPKD